MISTHNETRCLAVWLVMIPFLIMFGRASSEPSGASSSLGYARVGLNADPKLKISCMKSVDGFAEFESPVFRFAEFGLRCDGSSSPNIRRESTRLVTGRSKPTLVAG